MWQYASAGVPPAVCLTNFVKFDKEESGCHTEMTLLRRYEPTVTETQSKRTFSEITFASLFSPHHIKRKKSYAKKTINWAGFLISGFRLHRG